MAPFVSRRLFSTVIMLLDSSGGGGGSGGTILIRTPTLNNSGEIVSKGGVGGKGGPTSNCAGICSIGGAGGHGRIRLDTLDVKLKDSSLVDPKPHICECDIGFEMSDVFNHLFIKLSKQSDRLRAYTLHQADKEVERESNKDRKVNRTQNKHL